jgi:hypothetical protein
MVDAELMAIAGDEPTIINGAGASMVIADEVLAMICDAGESTMIGEGAGESVDPDPVVPTVGAN